MDIVTYALSKKYTDDTTIGLGIQRGKNCKIKSVNYDDPTKTIIEFEWTRDEGDSKVTYVSIPSGVNGEDGKDGISIVDIQIRNNKLVCIMSDGSEIETQEEFPSGALTEKLVVSNPIGSATNGKVYNVGTTFEKLIRDILIKEEAPTLTISLTPNKVLYDKVDETLSTISIKSVVGKKTYLVQDIKIYVDNILVKTLNGSTVESGGTFNYTHNYTSPINVDTVIKVVVTDIKGLATTKTQTIKFVGKTYYGYVESTVGEPTEAEIKVLQNNVLKDVKGFVYKDINFDYNKIVYAYPKSFTELTMISDEIHHYEYTNSFTKTTVKIDNIDYLVYTQSDASASAGLELTFK